MAIGQALLIVLKNVLYHVVCFGDESRYFALKSRVVLAAARLGAYEAAYLHLLPVFIRPGSEVVDVGANIGAYTQVMARLVGPGGRVFAFEPLTTTADLLAGTCRHLANVVIVREALSDGARDVLEMRVPLLVGGVPEPALAAADSPPRAEFSLPTWKAFRVPVRQLDDHLASFRDISFVKVDVEGHECAFLAGATETIRRFRPVLQLEASGLRADVATVERWTRVAQYVLMVIRGGRLAVASPDTLFGLNVYGVPEEMIARLPEKLLHRPHAA